MLALAEQVLAVVNPNTRLVRFKGVGEPYCEGLGHSSSDLRTVQPGHFGRLRRWLFCRFKRLKIAVPDGTAVTAPN